jgi:hypothetical protein
MPKLEININQFPELANEIFSADAKYLPLGQDFLARHEQSEFLAPVFAALPEHNTNNIFNLEVVEGIPSAVYGFTLALDKELKPALFFGSSKGGSENPSNSLPVEVKKITDSEGDVEYVVTVGKCRIQFDYNAKAKRIQSSLVFKKNIVSIQTKFIEGVDSNLLENLKTTEELATQLEKLGGGSYSYKLNELCHPDLIRAGKVKLPLFLNILSFEPPYQGDDFVAINLEIEGAKYAINKKTGEEVENPTSISVYDYMNAGVAVTEPSNAAKAALLRNFGGKTQIAVTKLAKDPLKSNPTHVVRDVLPTDEILAKAYNLAKEELKRRIVAKQDYSDLLEFSAVQEYLGKVNNPEKVLAPAASKAVVTELKQAKAAKVAVPIEETPEVYIVDEDDEELDTF